MTDLADADVGDVGRPGEDILPAVEITVRPVDLDRDGTAQRQHDDLVVIGGEAVLAGRVEGDDPQGGVAPARRFRGDVDVVRPAAEPPAGR